MYYGIFEDLIMSLGKEVTSHAKAIRRATTSPGKHSAMMKARWREWREQHPRKSPGSVRGERLRAARVVGTHTQAEWLALVELWGWRCFYCNCKLTPQTLTKDHQTPLSKGGSDSIDNLVPACHPCNCKKGDRVV